jgi:hypothetical protein
MTVELVRVFLMICAAKSLNIARRKPGLGKGYLWQEQELIGVFSLIDALPLADAVAHSSSHMSSSQRGGGHQLLSLFIRHIQILQYSTLKKRKLR